MSTFDEMIKSITDGQEKKKLYELLRTIFARYDMYFNNKIHHNTACFTNSVDIANGLTLCLIIDDDERIFELMLFKDYERNGDQFTPYDQIVINNLERRFQPFRMDNYHSAQELADLIRWVVGECGVVLPEIEIADEPIPEEVGWLYTIATAPYNAVASVVGWFF